MAAVCVVSNVIRLPALAQAVERSAQKVDWDAAKRAKDADVSRRAKVNEDLRAAIVDDAVNAVKLPVLVAPFDLALARPRFSGSERSYVAAYDLRGAKLSVMGSSVAVRLRADSPVARDLKQPDGYVFEPSEDGADLHFIRFGVSYTLRLSCRSLKDDRCVRDTFLKSVADSLAIVGGTP